MADEQTQVAEEVVETTNETISTALQGAAFGGNETSNETVQETDNTQQETTQQATETVTAETEAEEIFDETDYLKKTWGWESKEAAENEIKSLREKAEKGFEYKNDDSKKIAEYINEGKIDDLYSFLDTKKRVEKLSTADVTDKNVAIELVKFGLQKDNPNLTSDDIDFLFNEKFNIPKEPAQRDDELNEDFKERHEQWEQTKGSIERKLVIEAKMAQPKLAQLNSELVLPEIKRESQQTQEQPSQEDLEKAEKFKGSYLQSVEASVKNLNGFNLMVKDKDVEIPLKYDLTQQEKGAVLQRMRDFAENGYNATAILADLWVNEKGEVKTDEMAKDLAYLLFKDTINQKLINDAASKRLDAYFKEKKQINVNGQQQQGTFNPSNTTSTWDAIREQAFG